MKSYRVIITIITICAVLSCIGAVIAISGSIINSKDKNIIVDVDPSASDTGASEASVPTPVQTATPEPTPEPTPDPTPEPTPEPTPTPTEKTASSQAVDVSWIDPDKPMVALTFDDGPAYRRGDGSKSSTDRILDSLDKYNCHATFFVVGSMNLEMITAEIDAGHEIGNHTMTHQSNFKKVDIDTVRKEINDLAHEVKRIAGIEPYLVRPPWGAYTQEVLDKIPHPMILWSVDTLDWKTKDKDAILKEVKNGVFDGAIILMHDIHSTTADAVEIVLPWLTDHGYQVVSVSELFAARGVALEPGHVYSKCKPQ